MGRAAGAPGGANGPRQELFPAGNLGAGPRRRGRLLPCRGGDGTRARRHGEALFFRRGKEKAWPGRLSTPVPRLISFTSSIGKSPNEFGLYGTAHRAPAGSAKRG